MLALLAALLLATPLAARKPPPPKPAPAYVTPALWQVRDADTVITLFGSVHTLPRGTRWFTPAIVRALDAADTLVLEAVIPDSGAAMLPVLLRLARSPGLPPLLDRVPPARRAELAAALARLKPGPLDAYETWYAALAIANRDNDVRGLDPRLGVEAVLTARAGINRRAVVGLESYEQQLTYFDALPETEQRAMLLSTLDDLPGGQDRMARLVADWLGGRVDRLAAVLNDEFADTPVARRLLLADRNARWAAWIAERMKTPGQVFVAVGAGHLAGRDSLLDKLPAYGLTATRLVDAPVTPPR